ncbi:MAG: hypothetical protein ACP5RH_03725 [Leptodesmis sp.]
MVSPSKSGDRCQQSSIGFIDRQLVPVCCPESKETRWAMAEDED